MLVLKNTRIEHWPFLLKLDRRGDLLRFLRSTFQLEKSGADTSTFIHLRNLFLIVHLLFFICLDFPFALRILNNN